MKVAQVIEKFDPSYNGMSGIEFLVDEYRYNFENVHDMTAISQILSVLKFNSYAERMLAEKMLLIGLAISDKAHKT